MRFHIHLTCIAPQFRSRQGKPPGRPGASRWLPWLAVPIWLAVSTLAAAQTAATVTPQSPAQAAQESLHRQEDRARALQHQLQPKADVLHKGRAAVVSTRLPQETPCFPISEVQFDSPDAARFGWLQGSVQPYLGQCAGAAGVGQIAAAVDNTLLAWGYATSRVTLPAQNLADGVLRLRLHIGRTAGIAMQPAQAGQPVDDAWGTWRNAFPVSVGGILNVHDLEQGVEQMKRLPSQTVVTELEPGDEPDTSRVRILRQSGGWADRLRGGITLDNSGSRTLGKPQLSAYLSLDNPLGLNDILSASATSNIERLGDTHRSQSLNFQYSLPWGYNTFTVSRSASRFAQQVQGTTVRFLSSGSSEGADARWHRTVLRTSSAKAGVYAAAGTRRANSHLDDVELITQRRRTTTLETGLTWKQLFGDAGAELELGQRRGMPWRRAQDDLPTAAHGGPTIRPTLTVAAGSINLPFTLAGRPFSHTTALRAQHSRDLTLSVDQFAIGSQHTVRGFDGNAVLLAESGYVLRNEWSTALRVVDGIDSVGFVAIDIGRVWGPSTVNLVGDRLAGLAVGLRGRRQSVQFDVTVGTPLYRPEGFQTRRWNPYLSVTWAF